MEDVCVAFKAHQGWVNAVAVLCSAGGPQPVHAGRVDLVDGSDREALEPYHVAGGWSGLERVPRPPDPAAVIRRGRRKQAAAARRRLSDLFAVLESKGFASRRGVVLTSRGRLGDDLERTLGAHALIHVAEGEAIRQAIRAALGTIGIASVDQDEKGIALEAGRVLRCADCDRLMKARRPADTRRWTKEERTVALGAWLHRH